MSIINEVRVYRGANCGLDHYLLLIKPFFAKNTIQGNRWKEMHQMERYQIELLKDKSIRAHNSRRLEYRKSGCTTVEDVCNIQNFRMKVAGGN